jgi:hypothetical protein
MLTQVGAITTNGVQQQTIFGGTPTYPNTVPVTPVPPGTFPPFVGVTVFSKNYANPRIYAVNVAYEQELIQGMSAYVDFDWSMGVHLTRFDDPNSALSGFIPAVNSDTVKYTGTAPFPNLGSVTSDARSLYRGVTFGVKEHLSARFQMEANYTYSQDYDDDSK